MNGYGYGMGTDGRGTWLVVMSVLALALLVLLVVRSFLPPRPAVGVAAGGRSLARRILDERLARGELNPTEYRDRVGTLGEVGTWGLAPDSPCAAPSRPSSGR